MAEKTLTKKQFNVLALLEREREGLSQRKLASGIGVSAASVNKVMAELGDLGYVEDGKITPKGVEALEPYRVKRAIFIAAGFGSRLVPITLNTPKPLVRVRGKRIIDSLLDAVVAAGIDEIYVVRGYLAEQFDVLLKKYPMIRFIENPAYNEANNISSLECARFLLGNSYVLEADLDLRNPQLITKYQYDSNYLAIPTEISDDWCFKVENGVIKEVSVGGTNCYQMVGISYWTEEDGARLGGHIDDAYRAPGGKERYWDTVALSYFASDYTVHVRECSKDDVVEIDTFNELKAIDPTYAVL